MLSLALGLAELIPGALRLFSGARVAQNAEKVITAAKQLTGLDDAEAAAEAVRKNPELRIKLQQALAPVIIAELETEAKRLETINATMRAEYASRDKYVSRWRPTLGYTVSITWFLQMLALSIVIVLYPTEAPEIIGAMAGLSAMWGIALSILGISVSKRSQDKAVAAGMPPAPGVLSALANRIMGKTDDG